MTLREKAQLAEKAARSAGEMLLNHPHTPAVHKAENDFVTEMDVKSEHLIRSILLSACPEDDFYGEEEGGSLQADGRWIVDPIDGTSNFFKGEPLYTVSIAYELHGELVVGCVFSPTTDEMFVAVKSEGATLNGQKIHVSDEYRSRESFLHVSFCHRNPKYNEYVMERLPELILHFSDFRRSGSAAYDLTSVACGKCEGFFELGLHIYDIAAGVVIAREAGAKITGWMDGDNPLQSGKIIVSNGKIHDVLRNILLKGNLSLLDK